MTARRLRLVLLTVAGLAVGAMTALALIPQARERLLPEGKVRTFGQASIGGPFALTDHTGKRVTDADFHGRYVLVFFGFTFCPDVCPSGLQVMAAALDALGPKAERFVPVLITVDPERDTPEQLAQYVQSFHPHLVGLTGTAAEIGAVARAYRVVVQKVADPKSTAGYTINHSALIHVMGPDGAHRAFFPYNTKVDDLARGLARLL